MTIVYQYRIYCITDSKYEYIWGTTPPTLCPTNTSHEVNPNSINSVNEVSDTAVEIKQEIVPTGGNSKVVTKSFAVQPNTTDSLDFSFPYNVNICGGFVQTRDSQEDDLVSIIVSPDTVIGEIVSNCAIGATSIIVNSTVLQYSFVGGYIKLFDGTNTSIECEIISIDSVNSTLNLDLEIDIAFSASTPTYVKFSVGHIYKVRVGLGGIKTVGTLMLTSTFIPANTNIRIIYVNNSDVIQTPNFMIQFLY